MTINWRLLIPIFDPTVNQWSTPARLVRFITLLWLLVGLVVMYSASFYEGQNLKNDGWYFLNRQLVSAVIGLIVFNYLVHTPLKKILQFSHWLLFLVLILILSTRIPGIGREAYGATRWIMIGPLQIQPSELIKPILVLQAGKIFGNWDRLKKQQKITWVIIFAIVLLSILLQPNLSMTALCGISLWLIAIAAGLPWRYLGGTVIGGLLVGILSIASKGYQQERLIFLNPWADPQDKGYQLIQSLLAIASGGIGGNGFGFSQQKLEYLPFIYNDFIFAVYAEEFGLIGGIILLLTMIAFATLGLIIALKSKQQIYRLIAIGSMTFIVGQSMLHIGVTTGVLPTTGIPLPLFSYGPTSMIAALIQAALLIRVSRESNEAEVIPLTVSKPQPKPRRKRSKK